MAGVVQSDVLAYSSKDKVNFEKIENIEKEIVELKTMLQKLISEPTEK